MEYQGKKVSLFYRFRSLRIVGGKAVGPVVAEKSANWPRLEAALSLDLALAGRIKAGEQTGRSLTSAVSLNMERHG